MRSGLVVLAVALSVTFTLMADASAQDTPPVLPEPQIIAAVDQSVADVLSPYLPGVSIAVLVEDPDARPSAIDSRALSLRDARFLVFRENQLSLIAQMYCERLHNQGVRLVDLNDLGIPGPSDFRSRGGVVPRQRMQPQGLVAELKASFAANTHSFKGGSR